ncbi:MAG: KEOPS complex subunit Cgi121 [Methanocorpusculum sp.]|nr:KEOPS complex subunit Cgi121 [Methanocorpusculum sp.]MDE2521753.1 KEOPS complex subunit Cgi121 [Methanocorpusculum sp.]MDE2525362.1 KEOPS complex subunit Cgi121 [Methanocorpusculum sp.]
MMMEQSLTMYEAKASVSDTAAVLAQVNAIAKKTASTIVLFDAEKIAGPDHIRSAVRHAERSFASGKPVARTLAMEILLYASGQRQCSLAPRFGLHAGENVLFVVMFGGDAELARELLSGIVSFEEHGVRATRAVLMEEFGITAEEIEVVGEDRIGELVIERVALMDAYK